METVNKTCCFTGHRVLPADELSGLEKKLLLQIESLIKAGIEIFIAGGAVGFDMLASFSVISFKEKYPHIRLLIMLPCVNSDLMWSSENKEKQKKMLSLADEIVFISEGGYYKGCMQKRDRAMVRESCCCVSYLNKQSGGTYYTVNYAKKRGVQVFYL